jgi:hypothetical protein
VKIIKQAIAFLAGNEIRQIGSTLCQMMKDPYTLLMCVLGNHYKTVQWFHLACNIPTEVSLPV